MGTNQSKRHPRFLTCTWDDFLADMKEINRNYRSLLVENDEYLAFALRSLDFERGSFENWKSEIKILCCKINVASKMVVSYKELTFREFLSTYDLHKLMITTKESRKRSVDPMSTSQFILTQTSDVEGNCVICMENINDLLLPCLHAFCIRCIANEMEYRHDFSCPICKTKIKNPIDDSWEVPDAPNQSEVNAYLKEVARDL
ncbi:Protein CBG07411 [Caenorhabditis briggsae]|uniref:RING-type domain-containing protein n=3 Tax=Caenorhabditis briggsae TaxID=6238 RepID=A0AAE9CXY1_CAEBR|nr:Protein CBG07411 [Caenorhabditis briggsae]ULT84833.1 hypothetical protein L3Y34_013485 [Caenorhabditis briggsae]UMM44062.1 hypothetical protein L5515_019320 [Caenorhabditis briggsae]CAP27652.1 Protein CBG07411 [Caenorhabditis briggsae]